ncbi:MAG: EF-hand domain-containing protein, partial [Planctomycetota bacterium]
DFPNTPFLTGTSFDDLQDLDTTQPITLNFNTMTNGDFIEADIVTLLDDSAVFFFESETPVTSFTIPADTLEPGENYELLIDFVNVTNEIAGDPTGFSGAVGRSGWITSTRINFSTAPDLILGDIDGNGVLDEFDIDAMSAALADEMHLPPPFLDINGDGFDNGADGVFLVEDLLGFSSADFNLDDIVGVPDLIVWAQNFGAAGALFSQGDADFDGTVGVPDLISWAQRFGTTTHTASPLSTVSSATAIPEPTSALLLIGAALGLARHRRNA